MKDIFASKRDVRKIGSDVEQIKRRVGKECMPYLDPVRRRANAGRGTIHRALFHRRARRSHAPTQDTYVVTRSRPYPRQHRSILSGFRSPFELCHLPVPPCPRANVSPGDSYPHPYP